MWQIIVGIIILFIILVVLVQVALFVYELLLFAYELFISALPVIVLILIIAGAIYYYRNNAEYPGSIKKVKSIQQEYQRFRDQIGPDIAVSVDDVPPAHHFKYLYSSAEQFEEQLSILENSSQVYNEYLKIRNDLKFPFDEWAYHLVIEFDPLSHESEEDVRNNVHQLSSVFNSYQRYSAILDNSEIRSDLEERNLGPSGPQTVDDLKIYTKRVDKITNLAEAYVDTINAYRSLPFDQSLRESTKFEEMVDRNLLNRDKSEATDVLCDKLHQAGRLFSIHIDSSAEKYETEKIVKFAESILSSRYTQNTAECVDAYADFVDTSLAIDSLDNSRGAKLRNNLRSYDPLRDPQETIKQSDLIQRSIPLLITIKNIECDMLFPEVEEIASEIVEGIESQSLTTEDIDSYSDLIDTANELATFVEDNRTHPLIDADQWESEISKALVERYQKRLQPLQKQRQRMVDNYWEPDDLYKFDWQAFESLVGTLFESEDYTVEVTQGSRDLGVDVYAEKDNNRVAIQVKRFSEGNTVGREPLQKIASTLANDSADEVIVVTSSLFAETAKEYARDFGSEMQLINGEELTRRLIDAEVPPPS